MRRPIFFFAIVSFLFAIQQKCLAQTFNWVGVFEKNVPSGQWDRSVAVDLAGDVYTIGHFKDSIDLDPGPGVYMVTAGAGHSFYVLKLDNYGNFVWGHSFGTGSFATATSIQYDGAAGLYITGRFQGLIDFDPGPGTYNVYSNQNDDSFIFKLSVAGNLVWAHGIGNTGFCHTYSASVGKDSSSYITGNFGSNVDFDPSPGTTILQADSGYIFVAKYDAYGELVWAKNFGKGDWAFVNPWSVAVDEDDNVVVVGELDSIADFDPGPGIYNLYGPGVASIFVLKLDQDGNFLWANAHGGGYGLHDVAWNVETMPNNDILVTGVFSDTVDFDPGPDTLNLISNGLTDIFIQRLNPSGQLVWARHIGGNGWDGGAEINIDEDGYILLNGSFEEKVDFDPGPGAFNLTSNGEEDGFLLRLDDQGNFITALSLGGTEYDGIHSVEFSPFNEIFAHGYFNDEVDFDPGPNVHNLTAIDTTYSDLFIVKFDDINIGWPEWSSENSVRLYPNPASTTISIEGVDPDLTEFKVYDNIGRVVMTIHPNQVSDVNISNLSNGLYFIPLLDDVNTKVLKFIKIQGDK